MSKEIVYEMMDTRLEERLFSGIATDDCHKVGIWGGCGVDCFVYKEGRCPSPEGIEEE